MKKLRLDDLSIESFPTTAAAGKTRGTVHGNVDTRFGCPESYGGTCWISCWETCGCDTLDFC